MDSVCAALPVEESEAFSLNKKAQKALLLLTRSYIGSKIAAISKGLNDE